MTSPVPGGDRAFVLRAARIAITVLVAFVVLLGLLYVLKGALTPLALAFGLAYFLDPLVSWLERHRVRREIGILVILFGALLLVSAALVLLAPALGRQLVALARSLPEWTEALVVWVEPRLEEFGVVLPDTWSEAFRDVGSQIGFERAGRFLADAARSVVGTLGSILGLLVVPVIAFYVLEKWDDVNTSLASLVPPRYRDAVTSRVQRCDRMLSGFVRGQTTVCAILAVLYAVGFTLIGVPFALLIGIVAGAIAFIPYIGSALALVTAGVLCFIEYGLGVRLGLVVAWYVVVQNLEGFFLTPRIVGGSVGLHPVTVIVALLIGGNLLGFLGLLVAVPIAAVLQTFVLELLDAYRASDLYTGGEEIA